MSISEQSKRLLASLAVCFVAILLFDRALGWHGTRHFLPEQKMGAALAAGDRCVMLLGDSRMVAGVDVPTLTESLRERGPERCIAGLAIGGTDIRAMYMMARTYLEAGRLPAVAVLGKVEDSLVDPDTTGHAMMEGNNSLHLVWSRPGDVFAEAPGFPFASPRAFDDGLSFLVARSSALGRYHSSASLAVQHIQARLVGRGIVPTDQSFGAKADMERLSEEWRTRAIVKLESLAAAAQPEGLHLWATALMDLLQEYGVKIVVLELPMPSGYRDVVSAQRASAEYRNWFKAALDRRGGDLIDLSRPRWLSDAGFTDALHLNVASAIRLTHDLALGLEPIVKAVRQ
jgi:hypothetical protein